MGSAAHLVRAVTRVLVTFALIAFASSWASAYTIVMLGGRRIQIPDHFLVTKSTLTYELGATISATLLMVAIDIPATERANNEAPGSLLKRAETKVEAGKELAGKPSKSERSITNVDLLPYAEKRRASEVAYEKRRSDLGLPSLEESRRRAEEDEESLSQIADSEMLREQKSEEYWRARASALRGELAAVDGQISYLQTRLEELPAFPLLGTYIIGNGAFATLGHSRVSPSLRPNFVPRPGVFTAPAVGGPVASNGAGRGRTLNWFPPRHGFGGSSRPTFGLPVPTVFGSFSPSYDFGYDTSAIGYELDRLLTIRAGLEASQRELEDEARRAGALPGWLRP